MKNDIYEHLSEKELQAQMKRTQDELDRRKDEAQGLEIKFREAVNAATKEIELILSEYQALKDRAALVSETYGVPFKIEEGEQKWTYTPRSYDKMWARLDPDVRGDILDCMPDDIGWRHSYIC